MVYSKITFLYGDNKYNLEVKGDVLHVLTGHGIAIDIDSPRYFINGNETNVPDLKELFGLDYNVIIDTLYDRAFDLPTEEERMEMTIQ